MLANPYCQNLHNKWNAVNYFTPFTCKRKIEVSELQNKNRYIIHMIFFYEKFIFNINFKMNIMKTSDDLFINP